MSVWVKLLGSPGLRWGEEWLEPAPDKSVALLYHLAYRGDWLSRDAALALFWPETPEPQARSTLRQRLTSLRRLPYAEGLDLERTRLRWRVGSDVAEFRAALEAGRRAEALHQYGGPLLAGFSLPSAPAFEEWLGLERAELHAAWRGALLAAADDLSSRARHTEAATLLERLGRADPDDEDAAARHAAERYLAGDRAGALQTWDAFEKRLALELGGTPTQAAQRQAERIRQGELLGLPRQPHTLPVPPTPFVGRRRELADVAALLARPECRLLTLTGTGGVGKTRLALEVARLETVRGRRVAFAALAEVAAAEDVPGIVAAAFGLTLRPGSEAGAQLVTLLEGEYLLLVLDNAEHVLAGIGWLSQVLARASGVQVLATSREALRLRAEWRYEVGGLALPPDGEPDAPMSDAVTLLLQAARRAGSAEGLEPHALEPLCRLVEGLPLALELAAPWLRRLGPAALAERLGAGFDLAAPVRDAPTRHRSLSAVFEHSWGLLHPGEQRALGRLSIFVGGFIAEAAERVAGASPEVLGELSDKSLLRSPVPGSYTFHPLIRQYARAKLDETPGEARAVLAAHGRYHLELAGTCYRETFQKPKAALRRWALALPDIRAAWRWAVGAGTPLLLYAAAYPQSRMYQHHFRFREGLEDFALATEAHPEDGTLLAHHALLCTWSGWADSGVRLAHEALLKLGPDETQARTVALIARGGMRARQDYLLALEQTHILAEPERSCLMAEALHWLGFTYQTEGRHDAALAGMRQALELSEQANDALGTLSAHIAIGWAAMYGGHLDEAEASLRAAEQLLGELGISQRERDVLAPKSRVAYERGRYQEAAEAAQAAIRLAQQQGHDALRAVMLATLGRCRSALGEHEAARRAFAESLDVTQARSSFALEVMVYFAEHLAALGDPQTACVWAAQALAHPDTRAWNRAQAERLLEGLEPQLGPAAFAEAATRARTATLADLINEMRRTASG